ncbi:FISUMP domain-containing protein [Fibrobacter succinogenes]|uniref:FISUMP domain-containing protein n=1 Tax=Fibrobacter succinogenes TaxID=833 RepID=UPI00156A4A86|nr:FISUMP domain-containing protein [Fibrobacter succinogenes]
MKQKILICSIATACLLAACGDDTTTGPSTNSSGTSQISSSSTTDNQTSSSIGSSVSNKISSSSIAQSSSSKGTYTSSASTKGFPANYNQETGILTDERDGEAYKTAKIGEQIWMAQGLRYLPKDLAEGCDFLWVDETEEPEQLATYGRHYSWLGATRIPCDYMSKTISFGSGDFPLPHQGACPKGWHIPSIDEWKKIAETVDNHINKLLSTEWVSGGYTGTDEYGFNVLKPQNGNDFIEFITLDNSNKKGYTMVFNDWTSMATMETNLPLKDVENIYLRCLMD